MTPVTAFAPSAPIPRRPAIAALAGLGFALACARPAPASEVGSPAVGGHRVAGPAYSFELPPSWRGRASVAAEGPDAVVRPACFPAAELLAVRARPASEGLPAEVPGAVRVLGVDDGRGSYVWADALDPTSWVADGSWWRGLAARLGAADADLCADELVDLATDGAATLASARAAAAPGSVSAFMRLALLPTLRVEMDGEWARLDALRTSLRDSESVASLAGRARAELADASGDASWAVALAAEQRVAEWAAAGMPVASFLARVAAPLISAPDPSALESSSAGSSSVQGRGSFRWEVVYSCWDASLATCGDLCAALLGGLGLPGVPASFAEGDPVLGDPASAEAAVASRVDALLAARGFLGASATAWWVYDLPCGASVSGHSGVVGIPEPEPAPAPTPAPEPERTPEASQGAIAGRPSYRESYANGLVYAVDEGAAIRIVTPYYSVLVPYEAIDGNLDYSYLDIVPVTGEGTGRFYSHALSVKGAHGGFELWCYDPALSGYEAQEGMGFAPVRGLLSSDGLSMTVYRHAARPQESWEDATALARLCAAFVCPSPDIPGWAHPSNVAAVDYGDGFLRIGTPWYSLQIPSDAAPYGMAVSYREGLPVSYLDGVVGDSTHVLFAVPGGAASSHVSVRCMADWVKGRYSESFAIADTGLLSADGLNVCVLAPYEGDLEGSRQLAELWASWVGPAGG